MSQHDGQLPEDLRDIAERLSAARETPTPFELDELCRNVYWRVARGGNSERRGRFVPRMRTNLVAAALTVGLVLTSGVGVVLADEWFGGGGNTYESTGFYNDKDSSYCEYYGKHEHDYSWKNNGSTVDVDLVWDCKHLIVYIKCGKGFGYGFGGGPTYDTKLTAYSTTAPYGSSGLNVYEGGSKYTIPFTW